MKKNEIKNSAQTYYYFAVQDLAAARILLGSNEIDIQVVMFHLQQCVEKLLKAILSFRLVEISRTHDIERLIALCRESNECLPDYVENLADLNQFAVEGRYALIHDDMCDAAEYLERVKEFQKFTSGLLEVE